MCETLEERRLLSIGVFINPSLTLSEGQGGSVAVNLWGGPLLTPLTVHWGIANDSATRPADYKVFDPTGGQELPSSQNQFSVTFPAGSTSFGFAIPVEARLDNLVEGSESFRLVLLPGSGYQIAHPWSGYGDDPGVCTVTISDAPVRVPIYGYNWDREGGGVPYPASFSVRREGGDTSQPLDVTVTEDSGGSAHAGSDFTFASSVTIPAGVAEVAVAFSLVDDTVAEWTETAKLRVVPDSGHYILGDAPSASVDIIDNDLGLTLPSVLWVNNDDDNNNGIPDLNDSSASGDDDLYPVSLNYPGPVLEGATLTLVGDSRVKIWKDASKSQLLVGAGSSVTWVEHTGQPRPLPDTVYVEAIAGSAAVDDVVLTFQDSDLVPRNYSFVSTTNTTQEAGTDLALSIKTLNAPNGGQSGDDWTGKTQNWLVGQMADLRAEIQAPAAWLGNQTYQWTVPGNVLHYWVQQGNSASTVPLSDDYTDGAGRHTGLKVRDVQFFWVSTANGQPENRKVEVVVTVHGQSATRSTTFNVQSPIVDARGAAHGTVALVGDNLTFSGMPWATRVGASVQQPAGFAAGQWTFLQLVNSNDESQHWQDGDPGPVDSYKWSRNGSWVLDLSFPLPASAILDPSTHQPVANSLLATGNQIWDFADNASSRVRNGNALVWIDGTEVDLHALSRDDQYKLYIMYLPPGANTQWVPLKVMEWSWAVFAKCVPKTSAANWQIVSSRQPTDAGWAWTSTEPTWTATWQSGSWVKQT